MDTRKIAREYRLSHWAEVLRERQTSGESTKAYCARLKIRENVYYYWQRKLRETVCQELLPVVQESDEVTTVPRGWAVCAEKEGTKAVSGPVVIEIGKCKIEVTAHTDGELLAKVCRTLISLC